MRWITAPPGNNENPTRWRRINRLRLRCAWWWLASVASGAAHWSLAIATVVVAAILAGHPGSASPWSAEKVSGWSTAVAILAGLSGLLPWRAVAAGYRRANEKLGDAIMLYDGENSFTMDHVLKAAREAAAELHFYNSHKSGGSKE